MPSALLVSEMIDGASHFVQGSFKLFLRRFSSSRTVCRSCQTNSVESLSEKRWEIAGGACSELLDQNVFSRGLEEILACPGQKSGVLDTPSCAPHICKKSVRHHRPGQIVEDDGPQFAVKR